ncbi:homoserine dehydrogenase [Pseudenhygromyxa sp. WMMC2535]|uniref:homoserine dehydrogenase n=1 Tax=Pseudenhygromyxa sp. WMMC2535 TaxID=2712867 RepID=UPI001555F4FA|nr:homoserine dehydrogenase [Pseudenhygromyxa sp. WMMC2535]NVB40574.1 homoserine dehydrogenase [Pseudenhygromyxa sp. WMMC2535]
MRSIHIGMLGLGNVGQGVLRILDENGPAICDRIGARPVIKQILVRDLDKQRELDVDPALLTTDPAAVLEDHEIRVVVELIGGIDPARSFVRRALEAGKHVVTANKALLAEQGEALFRLARRQGLDINFEGSVAGGIPVLRALREGLASDRIDQIVGIVNGTSNYILDAMARGGMPYAEALTAAQDAGFAEADPTLDVEGGDAAHKLALLALVGVGVRVDPALIHTEGITRVRPFDIRCAAELGYVIKSLAIADFRGERPILRVHPTFVPRDHVLAGVHGAYNAVEVSSRALGQSMYYGRGAGMMPTGVAVVSDIIEVCRDIVGFSEGGPPPGAFREIRDVEPGPLDPLECENYLCVHVPNVPGVLGEVASSLGRHGVSIKRMNQDTPSRGEAIDMVIVTERTSDAKVRAALTELDAFEFTLEPTHRFRILEPEAE